MSVNKSDITEKDEGKGNRDPVKTIQVIYVNPDGTVHSRDEFIIEDWPASDEESTGTGE